ncbi:MAG: FAD-dependent oxidoreductase, partial [Deltaproteobacteria bacterium]|nr:FAD-dependent oxidoreductase [Deltaproteobacteria bacterium]
MASTNYDAIVVGGGSVGVPTALSLAQRGLKVLVIERRSAVG